MKKVGILFIAIGLVVIMLPILEHLYDKHQQTKLINSYIELGEYSMVDHEEISRQLSEKLTIDNENDQEAEEIDNSEVDVIGLIGIPKINVNLPILYDATKSNLDVGAVLVRGSSFPWDGGNTVIAAHNGRIYGSYFNRLSELDIGDTILVEFANKQYEYIVNDYFIVLPDETWILESASSEPTVTLITCTPSGKKRLIVRGELKK